MKTTEVNEILRRYGARQHGVVSRRQLLAAGVGVHRIDGRVKRGELRPLHRGVYLIGPVAPPGAEPMAATLACGPGAVASHGTAGRLWALPVPTGNTIEVIDPAGDRRPGGVIVHRLRNLRSGETTRLDGVPVTTAARTVFDLATALAGRALERAVADAYARRLTSRRELRRLIARHGREAGTRILRELVEGGDPAMTRSEAEELFLALVREAELPEPEVNTRIEGFEVDFLWRRARVVVEIDGLASHSSPQVLERDRKRDAILVAAGYRVLRFTWSRLAKERLVVLRQVVVVLDSVPPNRPSQWSHGGRRATLPGQPPLTPTRRNP